MKIALVSPYDFSYPGGVTVHVSHLARELSQKGHQIKILAPCSGKQGLPYNNVVILGRPFSVPSGGSIARVNFSIWLLPKLREILKKECFDIIHVHEPSTPLLPWAVLYLSPTVNIGTFHAYHSDPKAYRFARLFYKQLFHRLDGRIAVSELAKRFVARYFPGNYRIIPNGVDVAHFSPLAPPLEKFQDGKLNILFVGRLEKRKGLEYLLGAYQWLKQELPSLRLIIVGPGTRLRSRYKRWVMEKKLEDVVFCGYVPYVDLPQYYRSADVVCAPATGEESFGMVLLEAMAVAKPVVASNIEGYASVLLHGKEGLLVPPRDEQALARVLLSLLKDKELREQMGANGVKKAQEYSWEQVAQKVMDCYVESLNSSARSKR